MKLVVKTARLLGLDAGMKIAKQVKEEQAVLETQENKDEPIFANALISLLNMYTHEVKKQTQKNVLDVCEMIFFNS